MTNTTPTRRESDNGIELERGRRAPYTQLGDWIALAPVSHAAARLYHLLAAHLNKARGDSLVWPSRGTLAAMMRYSRPDKIDPLLKQLEGIGAIDVQRGRRYPDGSPAPNLYVVHETPPPGYEGEPSLESWYATRKEERQQRLAARSGGSQGSPERRATPSPEKRATPSPEKRAPIRSNPEPEEVEPTYLAPQQRNAAAEPRLDQAGRQESKDQDQQAVLPDVAAAAGQDQAVQIIQAIRWPARTRADRGTQRRLTTLAGQCLAAGHPAVAVQAAVTEGLPAVWGAGLLVRRLEELAATTPDPAVAAAAEREAAEQARERLGRTPHQWVTDPRSPSYCGACGRTRATHPAEPQDQERVDQDQEPAAVRSEAPDTGLQVTPPGRCQHGRRVCVTCHGGRPDDTTGSGGRQRPAPRQRPAAVCAGRTTPRFGGDGEVAALQKLADQAPDPAIEESARRAAATAERERMANTKHEFVADELIPTYCRLCGRTRNNPNAHGTRTTVDVPAPAMTGGVR